MHNTSIGICLGIFCCAGVLKYYFTFQWLQLLFALILPVSLSTIWLSEQQTKPQTPEEANVTNPPRFSNLSNSDSGPIGTEQVESDSESISSKTSSQYSSQNIVDPGGSISKDPGLFLTSNLTTSCDENLNDHEFSNPDSLYVFQDIGSGLFLESRKGRLRLVDLLQYQRTTKKIENSHSSENSSDSSSVEIDSEQKGRCCFRVFRGKEHTWHLLSEHNHKYVGQNLVQKVVISSKKPKTWEEFRVFDNSPDSSDILPNDDNELATSQSNAGVYFLLPSARFNKGSWLGRNKNKVILTRNFHCVLNLRYFPVTMLSQFINNSIVIPSEIQLRTIANTHKLDNGSTLENETDVVESSLSLPWILDRESANSISIFFQSKTQDFQKIGQTEGLSLNIDRYHQYFQSSQWLNRNSRDDLNLKKKQSTIRIEHIPNVNEITTEDYQTYFYRPDTETLSFCTKTFTVDLPYGSYFSVEIEYRLTKQKFEVWCSVHFNKATGFQRQIISGAQNGAAASFNHFNKFVTLSDLSWFNNEDFTKVMILKMYEDIHIEFKKHESNKNDEVIDLPWIDYSAEKRRSFFQCEADNFDLICDQEILPVTPAAYFDHFLSDDCAFFLKRHDLDQNTNIEVSPWTGADDFNYRKQTFLMKLSDIPGLSTSKVEEFQYYTFNDEKTRLEYGTKTFTVDIPYGSYFSVETKTVLQFDLQIKKSTFSCYTAVYFKKSTIFKRKIMSGAIEGTKKAVTKLKDLILQHLCDVNDEVTEESSCENYRLLSRTGSSLNLEDRASIVANEIIHTINTN